MSREKYSELYFKYKNKYLNYKKNLKGGRELTPEERQLLRQFSNESEGRAGIISGHGAQDPQNSLCLVPDNIILRPLSGMGKTLKLFTLEKDELESLKISTERQWISSFPDGYKGSYYFPGSLIPNISINFRHVFESSRRYTYTGVITRTIISSDPMSNLIDSKSEEEVKRDSLKYHDSKLLPGDIWDKNILLSDLLLILSRNINIYSDSIPKIPKLYLLSFCRSGDETYAAQLIDKCLREQPDAHRDVEPSSPVARSSSMSAIDFFINFKNLYIEIHRQIMSKDLDYINEFIPRDILSIPQKIHKAQDEIHKILMSAIGDVTQEVQNCKITPQNLCLLKNLSEHNFSYGYTEIYASCLQELRR
jgi:hypothetical protein